MTHSPAVQICPSCGHSGAAVELTPERPGRVIHTPVYQCSSCSQPFSPEEDLDTSRMIRECLAEDSRKGSRHGGGSGVKRSPKPGDQLLHQHRPEAGPGSDNISASNTDDRPIITRVETKCVVRTFRLTPTEDAAVHIVARIEGLTLPQAFEQAMGEWVQRRLPKEGEA